MITPASPDLGRENLSIKNQKFKETFAEVSTLMNSGLLDQVYKEIATEFPQLVPIDGVTQPRERLLLLFNGVADAARLAAGHSFDSVVYACSGSDISGGIPFADKKLITIDNGDLFRDKSGIEATDFTGTLKQTLKNKMLSGMHTIYANRGMADYAMELNLLGVKPEDVEIVSVESNEKVTITTTRIRMPDGRDIEHTNIANFSIRPQFDPDSKDDAFVSNKLSGIISDSVNPLLLSKAGGDSIGGGNLTMLTPFLGLLPDGATIVSDVQQDRMMKAYYKWAQLEDLGTPEVKAVLNQLQNNNASPEGVNYRATLAWGYAFDLQDIKMYRLRKQLDQGDSSNDILSGLANS
jgi:hypothetical protein